MNNVIDYLKNKGDLLTGKAVSEEEICEIEEQLGVRFANDYRIIVNKYGFVCVAGHEITGITSAKRLNVYEVTTKERTNVSYDLQDLYVIEQTHIDGIVIWQSSSGAIYQTVGDSKPEKIADSIEGYIK